MYVVAYVAVYVSSSAQAVMYEQNRKEAKLCHDGKENEKEGEEVWSLLCIKAKMAYGVTCVVVLSFCVFNIAALLVILLY